MKKLLFILFVSLVLTSCYVTSSPRPSVVIKPTYKKHWYKPWYGPKHYVNHPPRHRHH